MNTVIQLYFARESYVDEAYKQAQRCTTFRSKPNGAST